MVTKPKNTVRSFLYGSANKGGETIPFHCSNECNKLLRTVTGPTFVLGTQLIPARLTLDLADEKGSFQCIEVFRRELILSMADRIQNGGVALTCWPGGHQDWA